MTSPFKIDAIGHRVVHGGDAFVDAALIDDTVEAAIERFSAFAPLHNPASLAGIRTAREIFPSKPQVAVFDTSFHANMPEYAARYAIPDSLYNDLKLRRYGFHGNSHKYVSEKAAELLDRPLQSIKMVTAHLGNGCSVAAISEGICVDTSMGITPLEGLVMGTRSGDVDPAIFGVLKREMAWGVDETLRMLNNDSGFKGIAGTSDSRDLELNYLAGDEKAGLVIDMFCYRLAKYIASYAVPLGGIDVLVFTGGIGEKSFIKRAKTLKFLKGLGFTVDQERNEVNGRNSGGVISDDLKHPIAIVVPTNEEPVIARETARKLSCK